MGYLEGGPHHPPPISPTGHGGAVPTCRTLGMRVIPVAPLDIAYRPRPYTGVMGVLSALRSVARHTCARAATPCREGHPRYTQIRIHRMDWHERAQCRQGDPARFDVPAGVWARRKSGDRTGWMERIRELGSVCDGCPVVRECAADVVPGTDVGVIRAGVPLPEYGMMTQHNRRGVEETLGMIVEGVMHRYAILALRGPYD